MDCVLPDKRLVAASFSRAAGRYDDHAVLQREVADQLLSRIDRQQPVRRILDIGSGTGYCSLPLLALFPGAELISFDIAPGMLHHARQRLGQLNGQWLCGDAEALPLQSNSVDLVFSSLAIQWCSDYDRLFREVCRVARPGAQCLFSTFDHGTLEELRQAWASIDDGIHVNTFEPAGALCERLSSLPVTGLHSERQLLQRRYAGFNALATELRAIGARNMHTGQRRGLATRNTLRRLESAFMAGAGPEGRAVSWVLHYLDFTRAPAEALP